MWIQAAFGKPLDDWNKKFDMFEGHVHYEAQQARKRGRLSNNPASSSRGNPASSSLTEQTSEAPKLEMSPESPCSTPRLNPETPCSVDYSPDMALGPSSMMLN